MHYLLLRCLTAIFGSLSRGQFLSLDVNDNIMLIFFQLEGPWEPRNEDEFLNPA